MACSQPQSSRRAWPLPTMPRPSPYDDLTCAANTSDFDQERSTVACSNPLVVSLASPSMVELWMKQPPGVSPRYSCCVHRLHHRQSGRLLLPLVEIRFGSFPMCSAMTVEAVSAMRPGSLHPHSCPPAIVLWDLEVPSGRLAKPCLSMAFPCTHGLMDCSDSRCTCGRRCTAGKR